MAGISGDAAQLDPLFDDFITKLMAAAAADVSLASAISAVATARDDLQTKQQAARVAFNTFLRRIGAGSMTAAQRQAWTRIFGPVNDLDPTELGNAVRIASGG